MSVKTQLESLIPLNEEKRHALPTSLAALHLNRAQQTLRMWACLENGPIRPIRCNGRLAWVVEDIKRLMGVAQ
jgi:hypothetical protein